MKLSKKYTVYLIGIIIIIVLSYRLFFNESESTKLLKQDLKSIRKEKDSLNKNILSYEKLIKKYKNKNKTAEMENDTLRMELYDRELKINNEIIKNEENINNINSITNEYADDYLSSYRYIPFTEERIN